MDHKTNKPIHVGKYKRFCYRKGKYLINLNTQWIPMVLMMIIVLGFGLIVTILFLKNSSTSWQIAYILFFIITFLIMFFLFISDPGIVYNGKNNHELEDAKNYSCSYCMTLKTQKAQHCYDCGVCIKNYDHHCDVIGKCIGGNNICLFYSFVASFPIFFIFSIIFISSSI